MTISAAETDIMKGALRLHLARHAEHGDSKVIGNLQQLQTVVKITDSAEVAAAITRGDYPVLGQRQYLVACVDDGEATKVWGVYTKAQIGALNLIRQCMNTMEWKLLEIPEALEEELRRESFDNNQQPSCSCTLL